MFDFSSAAHFGDRMSTRSFLATIAPGSFYTYILLRPDGQPFYVGKGKGNRVLQHELEALRQSNLHRSNPHKCNTIRRIVEVGGTVGYCIDRTYQEASQLACLEREAALIALHKRRCDGGTLTNLASGLGNMFGVDPLSAARHASTLSGVSDGNPERTALNLYLKSFGDLGSVPIKPLSQYRNRLVTAQASSKNLKNISLRNCYTLIASAAACGLTLKPEIQIPRSFTLYPEFEEWPIPGLPPAEVAAVIENGAASDVLKLGLATLVPARIPEHESFQMNVEQVQRLVNAIGRKALESWELL